MYYALKKRVCGECVFKVMFKTLHHSIYSIYSIILVG